jgi:hypothetical protein
MFRVRSEAESNLRLSLKYSHQEAVISYRDSTRSVKFYMKQAIIIVVEDLHHQMLHIDNNIDRNNRAELTATKGY